MLIPASVRECLSEQDLLDLERILWKRRSLDARRDSDQSPTTPITLDAIRNFLLGEFSERGLDADGEATDYGRRIDELLGRLPLDSTD